MLSVTGQFGLVIQSPRPGAHGLPFFVQVSAVRNSQELQVVLFTLDYTPEAWVFFLNGVAHDRNGVIFDDVKVLFAMGIAGCQEEHL